MQKRVKIVDILKKIYSRGTLMFFCFILNFIAFVLLNRMDLIEKSFHYLSLSIFCLATAFIQSKF